MPKMLQQMHCKGSSRSLPPLCLACPHDSTGASVHRRHLSIPRHVVHAGLKACQSAARLRAERPVCHSRTSAKHCTHRAALKLQAHNGTAADASRTAETGDYVRVSLSGTFQDGEQMEATGSGTPSEFVIGTRNAIKGLEAAVTGLMVGEERKKTVKPEDAFGKWREEMLLKIPQSDIPPDLKLKVGERVMLGNGLEASVKEVGQDQTVLDCNPPLAGKALDLEVKLKDLTKAETFATATFGAGCFWGPELGFARVPGVLLTEVGYSQGSKKNPSYDDVCSGLTGHNEVVKVVYDPQQVQYGDLLEVFISNHNPTQVDAQGMDRGQQYRSGIYTHTPEQTQTATEYLKQAQSRFEAPIATEVEEVNNYYTAEDYHQQYLSKGGRFGNAQSAQKGCSDPIRCYG